MNLFSHSLINKIKFLGFILAFLMLFILFISYEAKTLNTKKSYVHHAIKISQLLSKNPDKLSFYLKENSIEQITNIKKSQLQKNTQALISDTLIREAFKKSGIEFYKNKESVFLIVKHQKSFFYFHSKSSFFSTTILPIIFLAFLFFIIMFGIYYYITNAFSPLVRLEKSINHFSKDQEIEIKHEEAQDEIANIANAFYDALEHNKRLKLQKDMYICMVMHEISTPLTKAKFITHFMKDAQEREKLNALFDSMQNELDKLHEFESISTQISQMKIRTFSLNALLEDICDVLLLETEHIDIVEDLVEQEFDYNLFIVAIKNLIDNALKYSPNTHVKVIINKNFIEIQNISIDKKALDVKSLLQPFKQGNKCSNGMGLGLFLIDEIITKHHFALDYTFRDNQHIFRVSFDS